jgi:hypothetical protein
VTIFVSNAHIAIEINRDCIAAVVPHKGTSRAGHGGTAGGAPVNIHRLVVVEEYARHDVVLVVRRK